MKKWLKITLLVISGIALMGAITGISIGISNSLNDNNQTVDKDDNNSGDVNNDDNEYEDINSKYSIKTSQDKIVFHIKSSVLPSVAVTANFTGDFPKDALLVWESNDESKVRVNKAISKPGEAVNVSCVGTFNTTKVLRVYSADDPEIKKEILITTFNHVKKATIYSLGPVSTPTGSSFIKEYDMYDGSTSVTAEYTYDQNGKYFHSDAFQTSNGLAELAGDPETASERSNAVNATMSEDLTLRIEMRIHTYVADALPTWYGEIANVSNPNSFVSKKGTTAENFTITNASCNLDSIYDYWEFNINIGMLDNYKDGDIALDIDGHYYVFTLSKYVKTA